MSYVMEPGSLGAALADLFTANPSLIEVSIEDIERQIDSPAARSGRVPSLLKTPLYHEVFECAQSAAGLTVYRRGPMFQSANAQRAAA